MKDRRTGRPTGRQPQHGACRNGASTPLYRMWGRIKERCLNPNKDSYHRYGGRGIRVCEEWMNSFLTFSEWATENGYQEGLQIDRINNDGNYEPGNCRFVTGEVNTQNQGQAKLSIEKVITIKKMLKEGKYQQDIADSFGVSRSIISDIKHGKRWKNVQE